MSEVHKNRRKHFFINKPLQLRYMAWTSGLLILISTAVIASLYFGIWGSILDAFNEDKFQENMQIAARMADYEQVRFQRSNATATNSPLDWFRESEKLSARHKEIFKEILITTNKSLLIKLILLLIFIAWGSIFISHKIAGPHYRFAETLRAIRKGNFVQRVHLRPGDEGKIVEKEFNKTLVYLDDTASKLKLILKKHDNSPEDLKRELKAELDKIQSRDPQ